MMKMKIQPRKPLHITERDIVLISFLTRFQFAYDTTLARLVGSSPESVLKRLRLLESHNLVKRQVIARGLTLWQAKKDGIELTGLPFKENRGAISFATVSHTVGLANLAAEFERTAEGSKDILGLGVSGATTVAEREIRQGQKRYRGDRDSLEMRYLVEDAIHNPEAPELENGNQGLFVIYGQGGKTGEHVPDLIVVRPRDENGKPQHLAIELELSVKSSMDWKRILRSYRNNGGMYSHVFYVTPSVSIANKIRKVDEEVGLGDRLILKRYIPTNKSAPFFG